jgi:hypothetical protein
VIEIVKNLPARFIDRLINNFLLEKLSGYFPHQLDAEGAVKTNALYLLQLLRGGGERPLRVSNLLMTSLPAACSPGGENPVSAKAR